MAALVDMALFEKIRRLDEEFERMKHDMAKAFAKVSAEEGAVLVDEVVCKVRKQKRTRK